MPTIDELLTRAASDLRRELEDSEIPTLGMPSRRELGWRAGVVVAALVVLIGVAVFGPLSNGDGTPDPLPRGSATSAVPPPPTTAAVPTTPTTLAADLPAAGPLFGEETDVILLLDDGIDGLTAVDPDRRRAGRSVVEGQRAGDEPYSMWLAGDKLVVGWSHIYAVDVATRLPTSLGRATVFAPAAEEGRVWMLEYGGLIGENSPEVWQVDLTGEPATDSTTLGVDGDPQIGVIGGLALQAEKGMTLWDAVTGDGRQIVAAGPGFGLDVHDDDLAWCAGACQELTVTLTATLESETFEAPDGYDAFLYRAAFSPDGSHLAAIVGLSSDFAGSRGIWVLDRTTGLVRVVSDPETTVDFLAWSPDGEQLFGTSNSYGRSQTVVWRYVVGTEAFMSVVLPFGGGMTPVVVDDAYAGAYLTDTLVAPGACRAPNTQPSGRTGICTFEY